MGILSLEMAQLWVVLCAVGIALPLGVPAAEQASLSSNDVLAAELLLLQEDPEPVASLAEHRQQLAASTARLQKHQAQLHQYELTKIGKDEASGTNSTDGNPVNIAAAAEQAVKQK